MQGEAREENFYGLDGDKIGGKIEAYIIKNELENLNTFSYKVEKALNDIKDIVLKMGGKVIFCAGDSILFQGQFSNEWCQKILAEFASKTECTASFGIGKTAPEAYLGLKLAKALGGGIATSYSLQPNV